jgi:hypothetical protein
MQSLTRSNLKRLYFSSCDRVTDAGALNFSEMVDLVGYSLGVGPQASGRTLVLPNADTEPDNSLTHDTLRLSMLAYALKNASDDFFFVDGTVEGSVVLRVNGLYIDDTAMHVSVLFDAVDWAFIAFQFAKKIPHVHHRWYFFKENVGRRIRVHARRLVK